MNLPKDRSEITVDWVSKVVAPSLPSKEKELSSVKIESLGDGIGQLSELVLVDLAFANGDTEQVVIKLQTNVPEMHDIGVRYRYYETEVNFYNKFANQVPMRTPKVFLAEYDAANQRVLLVMESFNGWHTPDQVKGATLEELKTAAAALSGLTAAFWNEPLTTKYQWMKNARSEVFADAPESYRACVDLAVERFGEAAPDATLDMARRIGQKQEEIIPLQAGGTQVLSHWDYRVANFFYGENNEFVVIDWQLMMMAPPAADLSYLLGTNIETELRRSGESEVLEVFHDGLRRHGIADYSMNDLEHDYRRGMLFASAISIIGGAGVDESNEQSLAFVQKMGSRMFSAIEDWDSLALLP